MDGESDVTKWHVWEKDCHFLGSPLELDYDEKVRESELMMQPEKGELTIDQLLENGAHESVEDVLPAAPESPWTGLVHKEVEDAHVDMKKQSMLWSIGRGIHRLRAMKLPGIKQKADEQSGPKESGDDVLSKDSPGRLTPQEKLDLPDSSATYTIRQTDAAAELKRMTQKYKSEEKGEYVRKTVTRKLEFEDISDAEDGEGDAQLKPVSPEKEASIKKVESWINSEEQSVLTGMVASITPMPPQENSDKKKQSSPVQSNGLPGSCLLYTSDAADECPAV